MDMCKNVWCSEHPAHAKEHPTKRRRKSKSKHRPDRHGTNHPHSVGASLIHHMRYIELDEQVQSTNKKHTKFVCKISSGEQITLQDFKQYKILSKRDFCDPDSPWFRAPIIVLTNRERYSLTHDAAVQFATATGTVVIRWMTSWSHWAQKPPQEYLEQALQDPCFYEYWSFDAEPP